MSPGNHGMEVASSQYSERQKDEDEFLSKHKNPMMMTIKKPMNPSSRRSASPLA